MVSHPQDEYGAYGSVPDVSASGGGGTPSGVHASPESFGGQVGQAVEGAGKQAGEITNKYAGIINETAAMQADIDFSTKAGDIIANYKTKTGMAAWNAKPQYNKDLQNAYEGARNGLPLIVQKSFDMTARRTLANHIIEGGSYAADQLKQQQRYTGSEVGSQAIKDIANPDVYTNQDNFEYHRDTAAWSAQAQLDHEHPGLTTNPSTGEVTFDESKPEGVALKSQYEQNLNNYLSQAYIVRYDAWGKTDPMAAKASFDTEKDTMPKWAAAHVEPTLNVQVTKAQVRGITNTVITEANQKHAEILTNPSSAGSNANNLGNVKTASGAANNTQEFENPLTPVDGVILAANTLRGKNYQGKTLDQIGHTWTTTNQDDWVKTVSKMSGIKPDQTPDLNDPAVLHGLMKGIATAEDRNRAPKFSDDIISQGVQASLSGKQPETSKQPEKSYATNPNGSPLTTADVYATHKADFFARGDAYAEQTMPGDLQFRKDVHASLEQVMNNAIQSQQAQYKQDNNFIMRAFNGDFTKGQHPTSLDELSAIPGVGDVLTRASVHSPEFVRELDSRLLTAASRGEGKDAKEYGSKFLDLYHQIHPSDGSPPSISDANDLNKYVGDGLTLAGRNALQKEIESTDGTKSLKADTYKAVDGKISKKNPMTGLQDPDGDLRAINAHYAMDKYWEDQKSKGVADDELLNPKNPKWVGNIGLTFARTPAQVAADLRKANGGGQQPAVTSDKQLLDDLESGKLSGPSGREAIKAAYAKGMPKDQATALLIKYGYASAPVATPSVPRPE